ncbi:MAG: glycosyltransferase [Planctomycetes bacterium]|nr:glycosyltransferase [Planctomycetota bacterium]
MRILFVQSRFPERDGPSEQIRLLAAEMRGRGHQTAVAAVPTGAAVEDADLARFPLPRVRLWNPLHTRRYPAAAAAMRRALVAFQPDVVHVNNVAGLSLEPIHAAREAGARVVVTLRDYYFGCGPGRFWRNRWGAGGTRCEGAAPGRCLLCGLASARAGSPASWLVALGYAAQNVTRPALRRALDECAAVIAVSRFMRERLSLPRALVVPNMAPPVDRASAAPPRQPDLFITGGRLVEEKGFDVAVRAFRRTPRLRLEVWGDGPERPALRRLAAGAPNVLVGGGFLPAAAFRARLLSARALVLPSLWDEGCPNVALDAFAAGAEVIASAVGSLPELLARARCGEIAPPGDVGAFREAALALAARPPRLPEIADFSARAVGDAYEAVYQPGGHAGAARLVLGIPLEVGAGEGATPCAS